MSAPAPARTPMPESTPTPNWVKWVGLTCFALGAGLVNVSTDHGKINWLDLVKHELISVGTVFVGGKTTIR